MDDTTNNFPSLNLDELSDTDAATQQRRLMT